MAPFNFAVSTAARASFDSTGLTETTGNPPVRSSDAKAVPTAVPSTRVPFVTQKIC